MICFYQFVADFCLMHDSERQFFLSRFTFVPHSLVQYFRLGRA